MFYYDPAILEVMNDQLLYINVLGQTFCILWFTDIFGLYSMSGYGIKIKIKFQRRNICIGGQCAFSARESLLLHRLENQLFKVTGN